MNYLLSEGCSRIREHSNCPWKIDNDEPLLLCAKDALISLSTSDETLFNKASYIRRDFLLALDRLYSQFEAHKGFLMCVVDGAKPAWYPKVFQQELKDHIKSFNVLMLRIDQLEERANGILQPVSEALLLDILIPFIDLKTGSLRTSTSVKHDSA